MSSENAFTRRKALEQINTADQTVNNRLTLPGKNSRVKSGLEANPRAIIESKRVQHVLTELRESHGHNDIEANLKFGEAKRFRWDTGEWGDDLILTAIPTRFGKLAQLRYGTFEAAVFLFDSGEREASQWITGHEGGAISFQSATEAELEEFAQLVPHDAEDIQAFTHSYSDSYFVTSGDESEGDVPRATVYKISPENMEVTETEEIVAGGLKLPMADGCDGDVPSPAKCATVGFYGCIIDAGYCALCSIPCTMSTVVFPAVAVCVICILLTCGKSLLPQIGACATLFDCVREYVDDYAYDLPEQLDFPEWYMADCD